MIWYLIAAILAGWFLLGVGYPLMRRPWRRIRTRVLRREQETERGKVQTTEIRGFLQSLSLLLSLPNTTPFSALNQLAQQEWTFPLAEIVDSRGLISTKAVLDELAAYSDSVHLRRLAEDERPLAQVADEIAKDILDDHRRDLRRRIERAPIWVTLPLVFAVFMPILGLIAWMLVSTLPAQLGQFP